MPPKFSLQPVLDYRHSRVEALEIELSQLLAAQQQALDLMDELRSYRLQIMADMQARQVGDVDLWALNQLRSTFRMVEDRIELQQQTLVDIERQVMEKRNEVVAARQDEETLAMLKSKEIERYRENLAQQESRTQDDIYIAQAFRKMSEGVHDQF